MTLFVGVAAVLIAALALATSAGADVDMTGRLVRVKKPNTQLRAGANPFATTANGTYRCADEYSVVANWYYYFAIGNCRAGWELEVVSYASENSVTHEHSYGGFVNHAFSGCGWIDTRFPLEKLNSNSHSACAGGGSSREFKVEESSFMEKYNHGTTGDGNPVVNPKPCPEYANYRPWSSGNVEKELIRTAPEYAASQPGSNYPAIKWRYVTKYASTDGTGKYVMVRDDSITGAGEGNWVFVPLSCLRASSSELPENAEERNPPPPTATTGGSSNVTASSATLAGSINPNGLDTHYYIEWGKEASKPYEAFAPTPYPGEDVGSGTTTVNRSVTATGLSSNTVYYYRLVAMSPTGTSEGGTGSFKTLAPPAVTTTAASQVNETEATLNGTVNPNGLDTHYHFEYGTTTGYGKNSPEVDAGAGTSALPESFLATTLEPGTTYHYRLVATSSGGLGTGTDQVFATPVSKPAPILTSSSGNQAVFFRGANTALWDESWNASTGKWSLSELGGSIPSDPSVIKQSNGNLDVYVVGNNGGVYQWLFTAETQKWSLTKLGGEAVGAGTPSPVLPNENVFFKGANGAIWHYYNVSGTWYLQELGGHAAGDPKAIVESNGEINVVFRGTNGAIWQWWWSPSEGEWHLQELGGEAANDPSVVLQSNGTPDIYFTGTNRAVWQWWWSPSENKWHLQELGGEATGTPSAALEPNGVQNVVFRGTNRAVWQWWWSPSENKWHLQELGGTAAGNPAVMLQPSGEPDIYFVDSQAGLSQWFTLENLWHLQQICGGPCGK